MDEEIEKIVKITETEDLMDVIEKTECNDVTNDDEEHPLEQDIIDAEQQLEALAKKLWNNFQKCISIKDTVTLKDLIGMVADMSNSMYLLIVSTIGRLRTQAAKIKAYEEDSHRQVYI